MDADLRPLVERTYRALAAGDRDGLAELLHPDFDGYFSPGLPAPIGGHHAGARACIEDGWWAIGAAFALRAHPERWLPAEDGPLVVLGTYRGSARRSGGALEAPFAHVWQAEEGVLRSLRQYTDTALWARALDPA